MITLLIEEIDTATIDEILITGHDLLKGIFKQQCFSWPVVLLNGIFFLKKNVCKNNLLQQCPIGPKMRTKTK